MNNSNCRICLCASDNAISILNYEDGYTLQELINKYLNLKIGSDYVHRTVICQSCSGVLKSFHNLYQRFQSTQLVFQSTSATYRNVQDLLIKTEPCEEFLDNNEIINYKELDGSEIADLDLNIQDQISKQSFVKCKNEVFAEEENSVLFNDAINFTTAKINLSNETFLCESSGVALVLNKKADDNANRTEYRKPLQDPSKKICENPRRKHNGNRCCLPHCRISKRDSPSTRFFGFPLSNKVMLKKWATKCNLTLDLISKSSPLHLCHKHFAPSCFGKKRLKGHAIPDRNLTA